LTQASKQASELHFSSLLFSSLLSHHDSGQAYDTKGFVFFFWLDFCVCEFAPEWSEQQLR
jgi:hypothetical protein